MILSIAQYIMPLRLVQLCTIDNCMIMQSIPVLSPRVPSYYKLDTRKEVCAFLLGLTSTIAISMSYITFRLLENVPVLPLLFSSSSISDHI